MDKNPDDPIIEGSHTPVPQVKPSSPRWSSTTKLVVALTLVAIFAGLIISFRNIVGPLLLAFVLSYMMYPVADYFRRRLNISWRLTATIIFLVLIISVLGLLVWGGIALVDQVLSLINFLQGQLENLPDLLEQLAANPIRIGPFEFGLSSTEVQNVITQLFGAIQPLFTRLGGLVGTFASSAAVTLGWVLFVLLISYFIVSESEGAQGRMFTLSIPGYQEDIDRMRVELGRIWNAFLRGQLIIMLLTILVYSVLLGAMGVRFFYGLALLAGLARFVPYVGPAFAWTAYGLVSYFQEYTLFGLQPLTYALIVVGVAWLTDTIMDNFVTPRMLGNALEVHPAAVMVAALVGASLLGIIGVVLAAPVLATAKLFLEYAMRKLSDQDPWAGMRKYQPPRRWPSGPEGLRARMAEWWNSLRRKQNPKS